MLWYSCRQRMTKEDFFMGKRARISKNDLPNQERVMLLKKLEMVFDKHMQMAELRKMPKLKKSGSRLTVC